MKSKLLDNIREMDTIQFYTSKLFKKRLFLGKVDIPLYSIFQQNNLDALFLVKRPILIFGYFINEENIF